MSREGESRAAAERLLTGELMRRPNGAAPLTSEERGAATGTPGPSLGDRYNRVLIDDRSGHAVVSSR